MSASGHESFRRWLQRNHWFIPFLLLLSILVLFAFLFRRRPQERPINIDIDSLNLVYQVFAKQNVKSLEVRCRESQRDGGKLLMRKVYGVVYKKDKKDQDVFFVGEHGVAMYDFNYFLLEKNVRIFTDDLSLRANSFFLARKENLSTLNKVVFRGKRVNGVARKGLEFLLHDNVYKMLLLKCRYRGENDNFVIRSRAAWLFKKKFLLNLTGKSSIVSASWKLRGRKMALSFSEEFRHLRQASSNGNASAFWKKVKSEKAFCRIHARSLSFSYDSAGRLEHIAIGERGVVALEDSAEQTIISADEMEIVLDPVSQTIRQLMVKKSGTLEMSGQDALTLSGDSMELLFDSSGNLTALRLFGSCLAKSGDFSGKSSRIEFSQIERLIQLHGPEAKIFRGRNEFVADWFRLDTRRQLLATNKAVKATLLPEKSNMLFGRDPIFVTAHGVEIGRDEKGQGFINFLNEVKVFQEAAAINCQALRSNDGSDNMLASGDVSAHFRNGKNVFSANGDMLECHSLDKSLVISGRAHLLGKDGNLQGKSIKLNFGTDNMVDTIEGQGDVVFSKDDLTGRAQGLFWQYRQRLVILQEKAEIGKKGGGISRGQELRVDLATKQIVVNNDRDRVATSIK